jgi:hypothetical protein
MLKLQLLLDKIVHLKTRIVEVEDNTTVWLSVLRIIHDWHRPAAPFIFIVD